VYTAAPASSREKPDVLHYRHMQTLVIDTNGIVKKLEQRGFSRTQAEGITEALKDLDVSALVTKADLTAAVHALELTFAKTTNTLMIWFTAALLAQGALVVALIEYFK
jgi:hypothetical protein